MFPHWLLFGQFSVNTIKTHQAQDSLFLFLNFIFCRRGSAWLTGNKLRFALGGRASGERLSVRESEVGGSRCHVSRADSIREQTVMEAGSTTATTLHCVHSVSALYWHTLVNVFCMFPLNLKGSTKQRIAPVPLFSLGLLNWGRATRSFALFSSSIFDS